jgi:hypothetical protein
MTTFFSLLNDKNENNFVSPLIEIFVIDENENLQKISKKIYSFSDVANISFYGSKSNVYLDENDFFPLIEIIHCDNIEINKSPQMNNISCIKNKQYFKFLLDSR